jgi:hypothetical protein
MSVRALAVDGRLVFLGLVVVLAASAAKDLTPVRSARAVQADAARARAVDSVLVSVDRAQQCYFRRRERYADTISSLQFAGGSYMRTALNNGLDIELTASEDGQSYAQRVAGTDVAAELARRGAEVRRLDVGGRPRPPLAEGCRR